MKTLTFAMVLTLLSASVFAKQPSSDMARVTHAILVNSEISNALLENGTTTLVDYEITRQSNGHNLYNLVFKRQGLVIPLKAKVKIDEDMRPTYADGAPKYESSIEFDE